MDFNPNFLTTHVGSMPHIKLDGLCRQLVNALDIPAWPQMTRRVFRESMYIQYSAGLPGLVVDTAGEKIFFDTTKDLTPDLETFYERYLADDVEAFPLAQEDAAGFYGMLEALRATPGGEWCKGQIVGPISFGLTITDQNLRASLYNETLTDVIIKNMAMKARWQVRQLHTVRPRVLMCVDEPYMASFGSAYISLNRERAIAMLDEIFAAIHQEGALAGVHCCANTDWSVLLGTSVDFLNLDAYGYLQNLALYPNELRAFLDRGGIIAWGLVPNSEEIGNTTPPQLAERLWRGLEALAANAKTRGVTLCAEEFAARSLITPACGLGSTTVEIAGRVLESLQETALHARRG
jgi:hypothetical protein